MMVNEYVCDLPLALFVEPRVRFAIQQLGMSPNAEEEFILRLIYYDLDEWNVFEPVLRVLKAGREF